MAKVPDQPQTDDKSIMVELSPSMASALTRILLRMNQLKFIQLSELIDDVAEDTGFGYVKIIIRDAYTDYLRSEKAYK